MQASELETMLRQMQAEGASDLVLTVGAAPQFRINGVFQALGGAVLDSEQVQALAYSILSDKQIEALEERKSLDLTRRFEGLAIFRFNLYFQKGALAIAVRLIPFTVPSIEELGLPAIARDFASRPHGLVLVTGPAGSGKSTTVAAMIDFINQTRALHIICIEDPIEYVHIHRRSVIDQREIGEDANSFSEALRSVFRQSPDVIMVGEMRDLNTVQTALTLAETGHLILATLHTHDTTHAIQRIVDAFPAGQQRQVYLQLSLVLEGVIAQQLIGTKDGRRRVLAVEVLNVNHAIRNLIRETHVEQIYSVVQTSAAEGMVTMNESLQRLVDGGVVEAAAALKASARPKELQRMLGQKATDRNGR